MGKYSNAAALSYNALNGLICVYKPAGVPVRQVQHTIITNLCRDLNELPARPPERRVLIAGRTDAPLRVQLAANLADHPRVSGARYQPADFRARPAAHLGLFTSGVLVLGINEGTREAFHLNAARPTRAYKVRGRLGRATDTHGWTGRTVERAAAAHVTRARLDAVLAHVQAAHQRAVFQMTGLHMDSQSTYELASQGLVRPASSKLPVLYGIKCVHFDPPNFTLEVQAVNEYERYLWALVHEVGVQLRSAAHCAGVLCARHGAFGVQHALLRKHWSLPHLLDSVRRARRLLAARPALLRPPARLQPLAPTTPTPTPS